NFLALGSFADLLVQFVGKRLDELGDFVFLWIGFWLFFFSGRLVGGGWSGVAWLVLLGVFVDRREDGWLAGGCGRGTVVLGSSAVIGDSLAFIGGSTILARR